MGLMFSEIKRHQIGRWENILDNNSENARIILVTQPCAVCLTKESIKVRKLVSECKENYFLREALYQECLCLLHQLFLPPHSKR